MGLWGRSMGAVTALLHADRDPTIGALIVDSPFASLRQLAHELVSHFTEGHVKIPKVAVGAAIGVIKSSVKKRAHFNVDELNPVDHAGNCFIPALFAAAEGDDFIAPHHAQAIHDAYGGDKNLINFEGDHNSDRPRFYFDSAAIFLQTCLRPGEEAPEMPSTEHAPAHVLRFSSSQRMPMNSPINGPFIGPALLETDSEDELEYGAAGGVAAYRQHQDAMAVALSLGGSGGEAAGNSSRRFGEHRAQRQRSVEAVVVSELVQMGFSDERAAEAARNGMMTDPSEEDALEAALTFL